MNPMHIAEYIWECIERENLPFTPETIDRLIRDYIEGEAEFREEYLQSLMH